MLRFLCELDHDALQTEGALGHDCFHADLAVRGLWAVVRMAEIGMQIKVDPSALKRTKWHEYSARFVIGGLITAAAGIIANKYGAGIGGLFLAFPAIFPAGATLIEKHETEKKERHGLDGTERGREAASLDAVGSAIGSIGLFVFALFVWQLLPSHKAWLVLAAATLSWLSVSVLIWYFRKRA